MLHAEPIRLCKREERVTWGGRERALRGLIGRSSGVVRASRCSGCCARLYAREESVGAKRAIALVARICARAACKSSYARAPYL